MGSFAVLDLIAYAHDEPLFSALLKLIAKGPSSPTDSPAGSMMSPAPVNVDTDIIRIFHNSHHLATSPSSAPTSGHPSEEGHPERTVSLTANRLYLDAMLREGKWEGYWDFAVDMLAVSFVLLRFCHSID